MLVSPGIHLLPYCLYVAAASVHTQGPNIPQPFPATSINTTQTFNFSNGANLSTFHLHRNKNEASSKHVAHDAEESLEWFLSRLRSYLHDTRFNYIRFGDDAETLHTQLHDITIWIHESTPLRHQVSNRLILAQRMLFTMSEATKYLHYFGQMSGTSYRLLCNILQFTPALLGLASFLEMSRIPDRATLLDVASFARILDSWVQMFNQLADVHGSVRRLFETEYKACRKLIQEML